MDYLGIVGAGLLGSYESEKLSKINSNIGVWDNSPTSSGHIIIGTVFFYRVLRRGMSFLSQKIKKWTKVKFNAVLHTPGHSSG